MRTISLVAAVAALVLSTSVSANTLGQQVVRVDSSNVTAPVKAGPAAITFNEVVKGQSYQPRKLYTSAEIENSIDAVRLAVHSLHDYVLDMEVKKNNPIKADIQNYDLGADKDIRMLLAKVNSILKIDKKQYSEQDRVALAALKEEAKAIRKLIPIADTGYALPTDSEISVIGTSQIQALPLMDGDTVIGHYRVACSGALKEDIIVNQTSVNYCVASLYINGAPRVTDASGHISETTDMFYIGITNPYVAGKDKTAHIVWQEHPKSSVIGVLKYYNLDGIPNVVNAMTWNSAVTLSNGTVYPGKNAMVGQ